MKTFKDLLLAMLNATLILVALCLFLLWQLSGSIERVTTGFAETLIALTPVQDRIDALTEEVAGLRHDLATVRGEGTLAERLSEIQTKTDGLQEVVHAYSVPPEQLLKASIETAAQSATDLLFELRSCEKPGA